MAATPTGKVVNELIFGAVLIGTPVLLYVGMFYLFSDYCADGPEASGRLARLWWSVWHVGLVGGAVLGVCGAVGFIGSFLRGPLS
jgi:hypothetical protein